ncbi:cache domain-containing protein [Undibacterium sp. TJN25]|uniref:cache domain-containing protein n=1 Tax=Undibacterium sp. TJN25 TaxID=3413056 RepID=UPI003BF364E0
MKAILKGLALALLAFSVSAYAIETKEGHGSPQEAIALVKQIIEYYKENGREKTFAEINGQSQQFVNKDLYVFAGGVESGSLTLAHGDNPKLVGTSMRATTDVDGHYFARRIVEIAQSKAGKGWVDYRWPNPVTKELEQKSSYIERVDDIWFGCGIYR